MKIGQVNRALWALMLSGMLCLSGCSVVTEQIEANPEIQEQASFQVVALLGDLNDKVSNSKRTKLEDLVAETIFLCQKRESKKNYEIGKTEERLWKKISEVLDKETIRQYGKIDDEEEEKMEEVDYVEATLKRLKKVLSKDDYTEIKDLMEMINSEDSSVNESIDAQNQMQVLLQKYPQLDDKVTIMNLLDEGTQNHLAVYQIQKDYSITYQKGRASGLKDLNLKKQRELAVHWEEIKSILPEKSLNQFKYFAVTSDGEWGTCAYVMRIDSTGENWCISIDPADQTDDGLFPYTIVHEYAHYLSLNEKQVEYYDTDVAYPIARYWDYECIANENSYLQAYYNEFWKPILMDWMINSENVYFYTRHQNEFVTEYAATDCTEDFAESFAGFVLEKKAKTAQLQRKYDFFERYPEFIELRKDILKNIKKNKVLVNPEINPPYEEEAA